MPTFLPLDLPSGMSSNGTPYQNRGKWLTGNRVRWYNGALRPIGGWARLSSAAGQLDQVITDPSTQRARAVIGWRTNTGTTLYAVGHNQGVKAFNFSSSAVYDITPAGFLNRGPGAIASDGYGEWFYGATAYGTPRPYNPDDIVVFNWCFRTWGERLLMSERDAPSALYEWDTNFANQAVKLSNAPENFNCFHVTDERIVMVAGAADEPRRITWSDSENNNEWAPTSQNQAGSYVLPGVGKFKEIVTVQDQYLILSETDAYVARYVRPPYVYGFEKVGDNCGVTTGATVVVTEDFAMWPSARSFYIFDGATVKEVDCPVMDVFTAAIDTPQEGKTIGFVNSEWTEIWWLFQSSDTSFDVDSYIVYNWTSKEWYVGTLDRTASGGHPSMYGPVMIGIDGYAYSHELSGTSPYDDDPSEIYAETAPLDYSNGDAMSYVDRLLPDIIENGSARVTIIGQDVPNGPEIEFGPYDVTFPPVSNYGTPVRARGRQFRVRLESDGGDFVLGSTRAAGKSKGHR